MAIVKVMGLGIGGNFGGGAALELQNLREASKLLHIRN